MNDIWLFEGNFSTYLKLAGGSDGATPISVTHHTYDMGSFEQNMYWRRIGERPNPAAELILAREDFDIDYFSWGRFMFVSERMREVMALAPSEVRFFEIDDSQSAPLPRSKHYQIMQPDITEDVSDPERSEYETEAHPGMPPVPPEVRRLALRADAAPKHDLFFDRFFSAELLCTDAFAARVLEGGCTGARFVDPSHRFGEGARYRTLRGIE